MHQNPDDWPPIINTGQGRKENKFSGIDNGVKDKSTLCGPKHFLPYTDWVQSLLIRVNKIRTVSKSHIFTHSGNSVNCFNTIALILNETQVNKYNLVLSDKMIKYFNYFGILGLTTNKIITLAVAKQYISTLMTGPKLYTLARREKKTDTLSFILM